MTICYFELVFWCRLEPFEKIGPGIDMGNVSISTSRKTQNSVKRINFPDNSLTTVIWIKNEFSNYIKIKNSSTLPNQTVDLERFDKIFNIKILDMKIKNSNYGNFPRN